VIRGSCISFANQSHAAEYMVKNGKDLKAQVYSVSEHLDKLIAKLKLDSMSVLIDKLTPEQKHYFAAWDEGT
jgi:adenosylhomocysteinase